MGARSYLVQGDDDRQEKQQKGVDTKKQRTLKNLQQHIENGRSQQSVTRV